MGQKYYARACAATLASCVIAVFATASAVEPIVMWDGASKYYNFNTLTRTVGDNTYTLNLNEQNTIGGNGSYIQIGQSDTKKAVTLTAQNSSPAITNAFGTSGQVTVIMKCSALNLTDNTFRGLIGLLSAEGGYYSGDNNVKIGIATGWNESNGAGVYTPYIANGVQNSWSQNATAYTTDEQTICMTYNSASGTCVYRNGSLTASSTGIKYGTWMSPVGIVFGGMDLDGSSRVNAQTGMKIEAIAVFSSTLTAEQVAAFSFPAQRASTRASEVNAGFGDQKDITLELDDGAVVDGDATFYATNINFICNGSITVIPPQYNTTAFDFSGVTGNVTIEYKNALPSKSGDKFTATSVPTWVTNSNKWTGTVAFSDMTITGPNFNDFGNEASAIRLSGVSGWVHTDREYTVPIIFENGDYGFALKLTNGNSPRIDPSTDVNRCSVFHKISGSGSIVDKIADSNNAAKPVIKIYDASTFTGSLSLDLATILICDSSTPYSPNLYTMFIDSPTKYNTNGVVRIESSNPMTLPVGTKWKANAVIFNGSVDFTTSDPLVEGLTVFTCDGSALKVERNAEFSINGAPRNQSIYKVKAVGTELQLQKTVGKRVILR